MTKRAQIILKKGKERSLERFHPWVFSGAVKTVNGTPEEGDVVEVVDFKGKVLGVGHAQDGTITVRLLGFGPTEIDAEFWRARLQRAFDHRTLLELTESEETTCYRLIHGEGDGLPGLIIDIYNDHAVIQAHSIGMHLVRQQLADSLQEVYKGRLKSIYYKSEDTLPKREELDIKNGYLLGENPGEVIVKEHGNQFEVNWETGQKTGFFIDQRENRKLLGHYAKGRKVLNTFCYSGGFSVYALNEGAELVHSLDVSKKAIDLVDQNVQLNGDFAEKHQSIVADTMLFIKELPEDYDIIVLDPPAFAKHRDARHRAVQAYKRLNAAAIRQIKKGGLIFTFSCSQIIDKDLFRNTIMAAAIEAGRPVQIIHQLSQPGDHPINVFHPEGDYLKGLVLKVD